MIKNKSLSLLSIAAISILSLSSNLNAQTVYFQNTTPNPVNIFLQVSTGAVPYEGETIIQEEEVAPGESLEMDLGEYWHFYLCGTDLTTGESWDSDFNPGVHVPTGNLQLTWVGAFNGGGFTATSALDPEVIETARKMALNLSFVNGQWVPETNSEE